MDNGDGCRSGCWRDVPVLGWKTPGPMSGPIDHECEVPFYIVGCSHVNDGGGIASGTISLAQSIITEDAEDEE
ncbi:hypothetical protein Y032_0255g335 [Ancylostoma ceylanicum]|nr:hypothetical protein Y032_0255g335 [Ancylostoma ceylanicum]